MTREQIKANAHTVVSQVSPIEYARLIGIDVNRAGFCKCPFHSGDNTGSMKVYSQPGRGWHCYGCGAGGDVVELAKRYYGLSYPDATEKVAQDMGIALPFGHENTTKEEKLRILARTREMEAQRKREQNLKETLEAKYWELFDAWLQADRLVQELSIRERSSDEAFSDAFCEALTQRQKAKEELNDYLVRRDMILC